MYENLNMEELLLRCLQGKAGDHEYESAYSWISSDISNYKYYQTLRDTWIAAGITSSKSQYDCDKAWKKVSRRTGIKLFEIPSINSGWMNIAASFIAAFILGALMYHYFIDPGKSFTEREYIVQSPLGSKSFITLPDNSSVWLNAGSTLTYSTHYDISQRSVHLSGEAYFKVKTNENLPFQVHTYNLVINALGTEFNVKAYPEEQYVETTLVSGLVTIESRDKNSSSEQIILKPNQRVSMVRGETKITDVGETIEEIKKDEEIIVRIESAKPVPRKVVIENVVKPEIYTSWKDKRLIFEGERMADLAVKLERIYDVRISFEDEELRDYRLTGSLDQETIEELLYAIRLTIPLDFDIKNRNVVFNLNKELQKRYKKFEK